MDTVIFDLDDTLVPVMGPIKSALEAMIRYLEIHMPQTAADVKENKLSTVMKRCTDADSQSLLTGFRILLVFYFL
jgi:FMN phosphatase YigB (HAD superfamily)